MPGVPRAYSESFEVRTGEERKRGRNSEERRVTEGRGHLRFGIRPFRPQRSVRSFGVRCSEPWESVRSFGVRHSELRGNRSEHRVTMFGTSGKPFGNFRMRLPMFRTLSPTFRTSWPDAPNALLFLPNIFARYSERSPGGADFVSRYSERLPRSAEHHGASLRRRSPGCRTPLHDVPRALPRARNGLRGVSIYFSVRGSSAFADGISPGEGFFLQDRAGGVGGETTSSRRRRWRCSLR